MNNPTIYNAVISGAVASVGGFITSTNPGDYQAQYDAVRALATEVDAAVASTPYVESGQSAQLMANIVSHVFQGRNVADTNAATYASIAQSIAAIFTKMNGALASTAPTCLALANVLDPGTGPVLQYGVNISGIVHSATGIYTLAFTNPPIITNCSYHAIYVSNSTSDWGFCCAIPITANNKLQILRQVAEEVIQPADGPFTVAVFG